MSSFEETLAPPSAGPGSGGSSGSPATDATMAARQPATDAGQMPVGKLELAPGKAIGRYVLLERLGAGGMGVVFAAYDPELDRRVAIKLLHPGAGGARAQQRLVREARAMAQLSHPNVVAVHDAGELEGAVFVAMEFVDGETLGDWLRAGTRTREQILEAFAAAGRGLAAAHARGLIHRDFKPDNVMVGRDARVRVMDFGLVRQTDDDGELEPETEPASESPAARTETEQPVSLTRTGALMGTPAYMAPEQHRGEAADARTDQFSYCVALYQALYGERPFEGDTVFEIMAAVTRNERRSTPSGKDVPAWLRQVVDRGLSVDAQARWPSMDALLEALARDPTRQRRRWMLGAGAIALVGAGLWGTSQASTPPPPPPPCAGIDQALAERWNDDVRARIGAAFAASQVPAADEAWARVAPRIDAYAQAWIGLRRDACLAAADGDRSQLNEMRIMCLEQREHVLGALLQTLEDVDATLVPKVQDVVDDLPRLDSCDDAAYLTAEVKPPEDPALVEPARALRQRIDDTLPLQWRAEYDQLLAALRAIADDADAIGYRPVSAQLRFRIGVTLDYQGQYEAARSELEACFFDAQIVSSRLLAARCANKLVHVVGDHFGEHEPALMWARHAEAAIEGGELDDQVRGTLLNNRGNVLLNMDRPDEALVAYQGALEHWQRALGPDHVDLAVPLGNIARVHTKRGDYEDAIEAHRRALDLRIRHAGEDHPHVADDRRYLAAAYLEAGRGDQAVEQLRLALGVLERRLGPTHPQSIDARAELGHALARTDAKDEGTTLLRAALEQASAAGGGLHVTPDQIRAWLAEVESPGAPAQ